MNCPSCNKKTVSPIGAEEFTILVVGNEPGDQEIREGKPFVGNIGRILATEMGKFGLDLRSTRRTNFWLHKKNRNSECRKFMEKQLSEEAKGKKAILLMGAEPVSFFVAGQYGVKELNSMRIEEETSFSAPIILASINPAEAFRKGVGELRLSIKRFVNALEEEDMI